MADMETAVRARLLGATPAGSRVTWGDRPQASGTPAIVLDRISGDRNQNMDGFDPLQFGRVQINALATSSPAALALINAAVSTLAPANTSNGIAFSRMFFEGEDSGTEKDAAGVLLHTRRIDALIHWQEA